MFSLRIYIALHIIMDFNLLTKYIEFSTLYKLCTWSTNSAEYQNNEEKRLKGHVNVVFSSLTALSLSHCWLSVYQPQPEYSCEITGKNSYQIQEKFDICLGFTVYLQLLSNRKVYFICSMKQCLTSIRVKTADKLENKFTVFFSFSNLISVTCKSYFIG